MRLTSCASVCWFSKYSKCLLRSPEKRLVVGNSFILSWGTGRMSPRGPALAAQVLGDDSALREESPE